MGTCSFCASIETVSLNLARQVRMSCSLDDASGVNVNLRSTILLKVEIAVMELMAILVNTRRVRVVAFPSVTCSFLVMKSVGHQYP